MFLIQIVERCDVTHGIASQDVTCTIGNFDALYVDVFLLKVNLRINFSETIAEYLLDRF